MIAVLAKIVSHILRIILHLANYKQKYNQGKGKATIAFHLQDQASIQTIIKFFKKLCTALL